MAKRVHVAGIFVSCMSSFPRAFVRTPNSRAALTIHAKLFTFTCVKRVHVCVHTHACVKFKVSGTVRTLATKYHLAIDFYCIENNTTTKSRNFTTYRYVPTGYPLKSKFYL